MVIIKFLSKYSPIAGNTGVFSFAAISLLNASRSLVTSLDTWSILVQLTREDNFTSGLWTTQQLPRVHGSAYFPEITERIVFTFYDVSSEYREQIIGSELLNGPQHRVSQSYG